MLLLTLLVFLFAGVVQAQANLSCIITPESHSRMVFGKRMAKDMRIWTCIVQNEGVDPIVVSRASALRIMIDAGVYGYSEESVRIYFKENVRLGKPKTIGRIIQQVVRVGGIIIGSGIVPVGKTLQFITVVGGESLPGIGAAISGRAPTLENFERLAGTTDIGIPGKSDREFVMFSGRWDGSPKIEGVISEASSPTLEEFPRNMDTRVNPFVPPEAVVLPGLGGGWVVPNSTDTDTMIPDIYIGDPNNETFDIGSDGFKLDPISTPRALPRGFHLQRLGRGRMPTSARPLAGVVELVIDSVTGDAIAQLEWETITFERADWPSPDHMSVYGAL